MRAQSQSSPIDVLRSQSRLMASPAVRSWRTAFLTLRDEITSPPPPAFLALLRDLVLSHFDTLVAAAPQLPPHEVTSDLMLLVELALALTDFDEDVADACLRICRLIHDVYRRVCLDINTSSWTMILNFLENIVERSLGFSNTKFLCLGTAARMKIIAEILEILRLTINTHGRNGSDSENTQLIKTLLCIVSCLHAELLSLYHPSDTCLSATGNGTSSPTFNGIWEVQTVTLSMIQDALSRIGSIPVDLWQSVVEVLRKVMDFLASKNLILENNTMSRFYTTLLECLHLVLADPKGSISGHVAGFVATLQKFFMYGLSSRSSSLPTNTGLKEKGSGSHNMMPGLIECRKSERGPYRPPHVRRRGGTNMHPSDAQHSSDCEASKYVLSSSDSDQSDSDGYVKDGDQYRSSKARLAAIVCLQDIFLADPKSISSVWTLLLPENEVMQPRKYQATLMTCLLFDPVLKIRIASASALASMLDGNSSVFLQVAEYKESAKSGSFTTLSSSLGQILMQLHTGILYLIQHETQTGLLASTFKVLILLISATPYTRMPGELLPNTIASVHARITKDLAVKVENMGLLVTSISCLGAAFSRSPPLLSVLKLLEEDVARGNTETEQKLSIHSLLLQLSQQGKHPTIGSEALQALRAVSHNYPNISTTFWEQISATVYSLLQLPRPEDSSHDSYSGTWKGDTERNLEAASERHIMASIKALDECLRASSGFKGADGLLECRLRDIQYISDCTKVLMISSAPSYALGGPDNLEGCSSAIKQWHEVIDKHLPLALGHSSHLVRAASITCFAGMTSSVFFSLPEEKQEFIIASAVSAALGDDATSVRSAACRAIGVISCFSQIFSSAETLNQFIRAAELNTHDHVASVRITASWALANICDSLRQRATELYMEMSAGEVRFSEAIRVLVETVLRLTKDGDKIKSNAVRALGNLARFIRFTYNSAIDDGARNSTSSYSSAQGTHSSMNNFSKPTLCGDTHWLERMVQAFVSCVTTGNVKVQWNVCHAMSNLFMNDTLKLQNMPWAPTIYSILLLLLRDSTNYKIRIHAAVALAVPSTRADYGNSFSDVVQGLEHVCESIGSDLAVDPSSYKYKDNLEKQLALTTLHVLSFASSEDDPALRDFLIKKAPFLEDWFKTVCASSTESDDHPTRSKTGSIQNQEDARIWYSPKNAILSRAIRALVEVYESSNQQTIVRRFEMLANSMS